MNDAIVIILVIIVLVIIAGAATFITLSLQGSEVKKAGNDASRESSPRLIDDITGKSNVRAHMSQRRKEQGLTEVKILYSYNEDSGQKWTCSFCGCENEIALQKCMACAKVRFK